MVFDIAGASETDVNFAFELAEQRTLGCLPRMFTSTLSRPRWAMPMMIS